MPAALWRGAPLSRLTPTPLATVMMRTVRQRIFCCVALLCIAAASRPISAGEPATPDAEGYRQTIQPLVARYCGDCHSGDEAEADFSLTDWPSAEAAVADRDRWIKALKMMKAGVMPPPDAEALTAEDRQQLTDWIDRAVLMIDCGQERRDPGRVTIRRLNRAEYNNTIRDLTGVASGPANEFPADDVGYGFDNIGDVLSLPPVLFEKYLATAEKIADEAIVMPPAPPKKQHVAAKDFRTRPERPVNEAGFVTLHSQDDRAIIDRRLERKGRYQVRIRAYADQAGDETAKLALRMDRTDLSTISVSHTSDAPGEYEFEINAEQPGRLTVAFVNDFVGQGDDGVERDRNLYVEWVEFKGPLDDDPGRVPDSHRQIVFREAEEGKEREAAREIIARFTKRAFRRPVTDEEVDGLLTIYDLGADHPAPFERGLQMAMSTVLASPSFLFRIEQDPAGAEQGSIHPINEYELATRLSYFLWSSMPDEELFGLAERGELRANLDAQIARMLADQKSQALVENFGGQWLQIRRLDTFSPDPVLFPDFDDSLRSAMRGETESFFASIMREDRSVLEFIDANYTFLNERLAKLYGIDGVSGDEFRRVELGESQRGGVLTQASVLAITSNPTRTSPVKRGKWVMEQLLGTPPPPPPPNVPELDGEQGKKLLGSLRERMVQHRENPACASCHQQMDTLGFGMENFDAIGKWRDQDGEFAIDSSGTLPDGRTFASPRELKQVLLAEKGLFARCLAEKMLTYALGRGVEYEDKCAVDDVVAAMERDDFRFSVLVKAIVKSDPFQYRRAQGEQP
jgi:hypothetical protein